MTPLGAQAAAVLARGRAALSWALGHLTLVLAVALAASVALQVRACNRASRAEASVAQAKEAARVEAHGIEVAAAVKEADLRAALAAAEASEAKATGEASRLSEAVKALLGASSGAHVIEVSAGTTGWVHSGGPAGVPPVANTPAPGGGASLPLAPPGRVCLFWQGDDGKIDPVTVRARYAKGTVGVVGVANAYGRAGPDQPGHFLFGGPLTLDVKVEADPVRAPGWSYGLGAGLSGHGSLAAVLVQTPPARLPLLGWPMRGWALGAGGASQGLVLAGVSVEP